MPDDLKVEQCDREAAADSPHMVGFRAAIRAGKFDDNPVVQSFARHRIEASRPDEIERLRTALNQAADEFDLILQRLRDEQPERAMGAAICGAKDARAAIAKADGGVK